MLSRILKQAMFLMSPRIVLVVLLLAPTASADLIGVQSAFEQETRKATTKLVRENKLEEARAYLAKRLDGQKNQPHSEIVLAEVLLKLGRGKQARSVMESLAAKEPNRFDVRMVFCEMAVQEGRWFEGLLHADRALEKRSVSNWDAEHLSRQRDKLALMKAACHEGTGNWKSAHSIYLAQSKRQQASSSILVSLGRCAFHLKQYEDALKHFEDAKNAGGDLPPACLAMAKLFDTAGDTDNADKYFRMGISRGDDETRIQTRLAFTTWLLVNNQPKEIPELLDEPIENNKQVDQQRRLTIAMAYRMQKRLTEALELLSALHRERPTDLAISNHFALVLVEQTNEALRSRALQVAESNVRNHGRSTEAWATLGCVQLKLGDIASAQQSFARAISSGVVSRDVAWNLAQMYEQLGNEAEAKKFEHAANTSSGPLFSDTRRFAD